MGETLPSISIVVPSYNQSQYLRETLDSLLEQNYPELEIIVMDGGSTDGSVDIIQHYAEHLAFWVSQKDEGQSAAINDGVLKATGEIVAWLNSDDYLLPGALWIIARAYNEYPGCGLYIGNGLRYDEATQCFLPFCRHHVCLNRNALKKGVDYILQPSTFFLRKAWTEIGGLNKDLHYCMDWDLIIRIAEIYQATIINENIAVSREYEDTKTSLGGITRIEELNRMTSRYSDEPFTAGVLHYTLAALQQIVSSDEKLCLSLYRASLESGKRLKQLAGNADGFPQQGDVADKRYVPLAGEVVQSVSRMIRDDLPRISIITGNVDRSKDDWFRQSVDGVCGQKYPRVELIVCGVEDPEVHVENTLSTSGLNIRYALTLEQAIELCTGDVVVYQDATDQLAADALMSVGQAFATDTALEAVYGNAMYIDENNELLIINHGTYKTGMWNGVVRDPDDLLHYWRFSANPPAPTLFVRKNIMDSLSAYERSLDWGGRFELFWELSNKADKIQKLERTLLLYRLIRQEEADHWTGVLAELYAFSRPRWPFLFSSRGVGVLRDYLRYCMERWPEDRWRKHLWYITIQMLRVVFHCGNPEDRKTKNGSRGQYIEAGG